MRIDWPFAVISVVLAGIMIGILVGFQVPSAKSAPAPPASHPAPATVHATAEPKPEVDVKRGEAVFQQYCATCHGAEGKGDGLSAQNLPIKPQNLTEGRVLNPLPDHFLYRVIAHGAQSVGLSPLMPAFTPQLSDTQVHDVIAFVRTLAKPAYDPAKVLPIAEKMDGPVQPIFFSHVIH